MRRAIVHVGLPRTGTTSLQHVLADHRAALLQAGILYPDLKPASAPVPHLSHQYLGETFDGRRPAHERRELLAELVAQLRAGSADTLILSYEGLCRRHPFRRNPAGRLRAALAGAGFAMETLLTVKPQAELLNSLYTLRTQWLLEPRPFADYALRAMHAEDLDYGQVLRPWRRHGTPVTHLVPLRDRRDARPLVARILDTVGLWPRVAPLFAPDALDRRDNRSPGPVAVEAARRLRAEGVRLPRDPARAVTREIERIARARGLDAEPFRGVDPDIAARIEATFADGNDALARECWRCGWHDRVPPAAAPDPNELAGARAAAWEGVLRAIRSELGASVPTR